MPRRASIAFGRTTIPFKVCRSPNRTTVAVTVDADGGVRVAAPAGLPSKDVTAVVRSKAAWILAQKARLNRLQPNAPRRRFVSGESILYLGRDYQLVVRISRHRKSGTTVQCMGGRFHIELPHCTSMKRQRALCRSAIVAWMREKAHHHSVRHCERACSLLGIPMPKVAVRDLGGRWGSCTPAGRILVHWRTVMAPMPLVEYVCTHEVCHLLHPDHSVAFQRMLTRTLPSWREREIQLAARGRRFDL